MLCDQPVEQCKNSRRNALEFCQHRSDVLPSSSAASRRIVPTYPLATAQGSRGGGGVSPPAPPTSSSSRQASPSSIRLISFTNSFIVHLQSFAPPASSPITCHFITPTPPCHFPLRPPAPPRYPRSGGLSCYPRAPQQPQTHVPTSRFPFLIRPFPGSIASSAEGFAFDPIKGTHP